MANTQTLIAQAHSALGQGDLPNPHVEIFWMMWRRRKRSILHRSCQMVVASFITHLP